MPGERAVACSSRTPYFIREARIADLPMLPGIEHAAAQRFIDTPYARIAQEAPSPVDEFRSWLQRRSLFVAVTHAEEPVGFAIVFELDGAAHLHEVDVHPHHGRRGVGRRLVEHVASWAASQGYRRLTLTTFREIPWNAPFYRRLGFRETASCDGGPGLQVLRDRERANGLPVQNRLFMALDMLWRNHGSSA